jgi:hypothetical protein
VVADRSDVEAHHVGRFDRGLVVEVARDQGRGADHVARVDPDRAVGVRACGPVEVGTQPGRATDAGLGRLEVAVKVVHAKQLQLDGAVVRRRGRGFVCAGVQAEEGHKQSGREGGRSRQ